MTENNENTNKAFSLEYIFIQDFSFEAPKPISILGKVDNPRVDFEIGNGHKHIQENTYEVYLQFNLKATNQGGEGEVIYLLELRHCGLFNIIGMNAQELNYLVHTKCPEIIFPYAREAISSNIQRGGFPPFFIEPINFEGMYLQHLQNQQSEHTNGAETAH